MTWQDPMDDTQQTETRRRIRNILRALVSELQSRGLNVVREDENTLIVNGMTFTASDQLSDTYNDVCYRITDYNQMIDCTLSRIEECADTIEELLEVQVEKMTFADMVQKQRQKNGLAKMEEFKFEVGGVYQGYSDIGGYEPYITIVRRTDSNVWFDTEYGDESVRARIEHQSSYSHIVDGELQYVPTECLSDVKILDNAYFYATSKQN